MKEGDVLLYKGGNNILQKSIRIVTNSEFVHTGIIESMEYDNNVWTAQAYYNGFVKRFYFKTDLQALIDSGKVVIRSPNVKLIGLPDYVEKYLGIGYGFFQLVVILIKRYTGITIYKDGLRNLICSEVTGRLLYDGSGGKIDLPKEFNKPFDELTPEDLAVSKQLTSSS